MKWKYSLIANIKELYLDECGNEESWEGHIKGVKVSEGWTDINQVGEKCDDEKSKETVGIVHAKFLWQKGFSQYFQDEEKFHVTGTHV